MKNLFILLFLSISLSLSAQSNFEGKIIFDISFPGLEDTEGMAAMLPKECTVYIKGHKSRTEMGTGMMANSTISDGKAKTATVLMDMMGSKYAVKMTEEDMQAVQDKEKTKTKVNLLNETKTIAGYTCKKAEIIMEENDKIIVYYTSEIGGKDMNWTSEFNKIDGFLMEYETTQGGMTMKMVAKKVIKEFVPDSKFAIPSEYKITTQQELQKMFSGPAQE